MSRIGKLPIAIPSGVEVKIGEGNFVSVKGPKGSLEQKLSEEMIISIEDNEIIVKDQVI